MNAEYKRYLLERFEGEVEGESFFVELSERAEDADRKRKWRALAQLETETKEHIRAALKELGVEQTEQHRSVERGKQLAERFSRMPWLEFMKEVFRPSLENFAAMFKEAEKLAPEGGKERHLLRHITRHEQALLAFAARELDGRSETSLEAVQAMLGKPQHHAHQMY